LFFLFYYSLKTSELSVGMEDLNVTHVEGDHTRYVTLFDEDDTNFIKDFFGNHGNFLKKPLLTKNDIKQFQLHFNLPPSNDVDFVSMSFEELFPKLSLDFQKEHNIVFTALEGQHRGYSGLMSMLSSEYDFLSDHPMFQPNSLERRHYNRFLSNDNVKGRNLDFQDIQRLMNNKEVLPVLAQTINVRVRACVKPVTTAEESAKVLSELENISKSWSDEKRTSSSPSASTIMAKVFSEIHRFVKQTTTTTDGTVYNPHAVLAYPRHRLFYRHVSEIFDLPIFIDYCHQPTIEKFKAICYELQEVPFHSAEDKDRYSNKKPLLPYFLNCTNMLQIESVSCSEEKGVINKENFAYYDACELSIMVTAPLFHKPIWEGIHGREYCNEASNRLLWYLQKYNRTIWNQGSITLKTFDKQFGVPRPEEHHQKMHDIQCLNFMMLMLMHALSASDEQNLNPFVDVIQMLDKAEPHVAKVEVSFTQYGEMA